MLLIISRCAGVFLRNTLKPSVLSLTECHSSLSRLPAWPVLRSPLLKRPGMGSAWHALHATKCYVFPAVREFGKPCFRRKFLMNRRLWLFVSRHSFRRQLTQLHGNKEVAS